jgi:hypothetical protein
MLFEAIRDFEQGEQRPQHNVVALQNQYCQSADRFNAGLVREGGCQTSRTKKSRTQEIFLSKVRTGRGDSFEYTFIG